MPATLATALVLGALAGSLPGNAPGRGGFLLFACATMSLFLLLRNPVQPAWLAFVEWFRALPITLTGASTMHIVQGLLFLFFGVGLLVVDYRSLSLGWLPCG